MDWLLSLDQIEPQHQPVVGGKCFALGQAARAGVRVPRTLCVTTAAYEQYVISNGLRERIMLELNRKRFEDMRWEEMWDAALRIRNLFLTKPLPADLARVLGQGIAARFGEGPVVVRSSAPGEDSARVSFAGLHESFVNVRGLDSILEHVRLVWASLWSDAALLYRQELGLDVASSRMAVAVQEIVVGARSGVAFSHHPNDRSQAVVEAVHGLNQGLVDGSVEPDRWVVERASGEIVAHTPATRERAARPVETGVRLLPLRPALAARPPLAAGEVLAVLEQVEQLEPLFGHPQDVEWTWGERGLVVLQARPITTLTTAGDGADQRRWYLSLRRSFENLKALRARIEGELIPGMVEAADALAARDVIGLSDSALAAAIDERQRIHDGWVDVYWAEFIPFAHGIRLFGQVYNDAVHPDDAYEFMDLLAATGMASLEGNRALERMAAAIRSNASLAGALRARDLTALDADFRAMVDDFVSRFGDLSCAITGGSQCSETPDALVRILLEMAAHPPPEVSRGPRDVEALRAAFLDRFEDEERAQAVELLDLARASYRLRDDDNVYLGRIEAQALIAANEGRRRLAERGVDDPASWAPDDVARALRDPSHVPQPSGEARQAGQRGGSAGAASGLELRGRQLIGQPAGPGIARGPARVIESSADLADFQHGEVLVCDAVDPNMTFVVPLATAVIERRGGMLIHGAIIAREYGLPCVTGIPDAVSLIATGDQLTVDGYLGIVTLTRTAEGMRGS
jgi:pyruvate,water dikinase